MGKKSSKQANIYHRQVFAYLCGHEKAKSIYEIAKHFKNRVNRNKYSKAVKDLIEFGTILKNKEGYKLNTDGILSKSEIREIIKANEKQIIESMKPSNKITFSEWLDKLPKISPKYAKKLYNKYIKK